MDIYKSISNKSTKVLLILIAGTLGFISGCGGAGNGGGGGGPGGNNGGGATMYDYVCENGTPKEGKSQTENDNKCRSCEPGYTLASETMHAGAHLPLCMRKRQPVRTASRSPKTRTDAGRATHATCWITAGANPYPTYAKTERPLADSL